MKTTVLDFEQLKKFSEEKRHQETIWSDDHGRINLICMRPGQEIVTHTHHGNHTWVVLEGTGELLSGKQSQTIDRGKIVVVPPLVDHGIRNTSQSDLVLASFAAKGD